MIEIREAGEDELEHLVAIRNTVWPQDPISADDYRDWRRQAEDMVSLLVTENGIDIGGGSGVDGWHSPPGVGLVRICVLEQHRGRGAGDVLLERLSDWLRRHGCVEATSTVSENDPGSLEWAARRGFQEIGRNSVLALDLASASDVTASLPPGIMIATWAERPDAARGMYDVYVEAAPDIPGEHEVEIQSFESWLATDMQGLSDRPEATFVAFAGDEVVGYAKLSIPAAGGHVAWHDLTGVKRSWRGRGIAGALKRAQIGWAKAHGYARLTTFNEERNEPVRRLNQRHGYVLEPGFVTVRGSIVPTGGS